MKKRIFSLLLALCLVAGMLPTVAYAYDNYDAIDSGTFNEEVTNRGTINGGTFNKAVTNSGTINNGEFNNTVTNTPGSYISNGTFNGIVYNRGGCQIAGGTFNNTVNNDSASDYILGGTFYGTVNNNSGAKIQGGVFNGKVNNTGTAKIQNGTFYSTVNNNFDCDIKSGTFYGDVENNGNITGGTFYGTITGSGTVSGATYRRIVTFDSNGGSEVSSQDILKDSTATEPLTPIKEDCTFEGWYNGDTLYDFSTPVTENITLTAKWSIDRIKLTKAILESTYKVSSELGDYYKLPDGHYYLGENISVDKKIEIGDRSAANNVILDLNGYELRKDNSGALLFLQNDSTLTVMDSSVTKLGKIVSNYAIGFNDSGKLNANGGTIEGNVYLHAENARIDNTDPSNITVFREGQINGDRSSADINGGIFYSTVSNYSGRITGGTFYGTVSGGTIEDSAKVTVTFESDGGSDVAEQKVLRGQKVTEPTAPTKAGYEFEGWYNDATIYDFNQAVTKNITLTARWKDIEKPVITGLETGKTYCDAVEFEVSDNDGIASVKAGDEELTAGTNGKYTLAKGVGKVTVVARDNAGNTAEVTVTVNNGHCGGTATCISKAVCEYCKTEYGEADSSNHNLEKISAQAPTYTEAGYKEHWQCKDCKKYFSDADSKNEIDDIEAWKTGDGKIDKLTAPAPVKSDSVSSDKDGNVSVTIEKSIVTVNGKTEVTVSDSIANTILSKLASSSTKKVIINATTGKNTASKPIAAGPGTSTYINLPESAVNKLAEVEGIEIALVTDNGKVVLDKETIAAVAAKADNNGQVTLVIETVEQNNNLLKIELIIKTSNGDVTDFNKGNVKVTVAISEVLKGKKPVCVYIDEDGRYHKIGGMLNADGTFTFVIGHFSTYAIMAEEEADTAIAAQQKAESLAALADQKLTARSKLVTMKNGKKAVLITWYNRNGEMMDFDGVEIFRSTKRNSGYGKKPIFTSATGKYYNTAIKSGTRYYYRVRGYVIIDGQKHYTDLSLMAIRTVK